MNLLGEAVALHEEPHQGAGAQGRSQAHPAAPAGMREFHDIIGLIAKHGNSDVRQPTTHHLDHLARPLAMVLCLSPRRSLTCGVGAGTLRKGKAQGRVFQRSPLVLTVRLRLEAKGSR